jgi:uncharacterized membrane protein YhaH (DUF805 family)
MSTAFSLWYLLALVPIAVGAVAVFLTHNDQVIGRLEFLVRLFGLCAFGILLAFVLRLRDENIASAIMALYLLAGFYVIPYWATSRLRDMGTHNKYWAVLATIPLIGPIYLVYLLCAKSAADLAPETEDDLPPIVSQEILDAIEAEKAAHEPRTAA